MNQSENMNTSAQETKEYEQRSAEEVKKDMEATHSGKKCSQEGDHTAEEKRASGDTQSLKKYRARSDEEVAADMERTYTGGIARRRATALQRINGNIRKHQISQH